MSLLLSGSDAGDRRAVAGAGVEGDALAVALPPVSSPPPPSPAALQASAAEFVAGALDAGDDEPFEMGESAATLHLVAELREINPSLGDRERARIGAAVARFSARYELDPDLVAAVMLVESGARPWAHSPKGAIGLMQIMPHMMGPLGLAGNAATIEANIEAGCHILADNIRRLGLERGISAYFWGSQIRGVAYLEKVLEARDRVRRLRTS